jgi:hypothetical protein
MDQTLGANPKTAESPTVIFLHIGKTGGSTLRKILHRNFKRSEVLLVRSEQRHDSFRPRREGSLGDLAAMPPTRLRQVRLLEGHMIFGPHEFVPGPSTYITLLRKPVALAISQYRFVLRTPGHRLHEIVTSERMTLEDYLRSGLSLEVDNSQTRAVSGDVNTPFGAVTRDMLEDAKRNIQEHFSVVGLTERFDETVVLLHNVFGWKRLTYSRVKVGPKSQHEPVSQATIRHLEELNRFDAELYDFASGRFEETVRRYPSFERDLSRFKRMNSLNRPWGAITYTLPKRALAFVKR